MFGERYCLSNYVGEISRKTPISGSGFLTYTLTCTDTLHTHIHTHNAHTSMFMNTMRWQKCNRHRVTVAFRIINYN